MVQAHQRALDLKVCIDLSAQGKSPVTKRMQVADFDSLTSQAKKLATQNDISEADFALRYNDGDDWVIVEDQDDLDLALATAPNCEGKLTFTVKPSGGSKRARNARGQKEKGVARKALKNFIDNELNKKEPEAVASLFGSLDIQPAPKNFKNQFVTPGSEAQAEVQSPEKKVDADQRVILRELMQTFKQHRRGKRNQERDETPQEPEAKEFSPLALQFLEKINLGGLTPQELKQKVIEFSIEQKQNAAPRQSHKEKRALIQQKPEEVILLSPGKPQNVEIEVLNDTHYPWKEGCTLTLAENQGDDSLPIQKIDMPVLEKVGCKSTLKLQVALSLADNHTADPRKEYEVPLTFRNPKKTAFGEVITLKVKCTDEAAAGVNIYRA